MALRPASAPASLTERSPLLPEEEEPFPPPSASPPLPSALAPVPFPFPEPSQSDVKRTAPAAGTDAIMKNDERQEEQTDEEAALIASGSSIPFPRQPDPAKPFRAPEDETIRFRVTNFYQRNQGLMLIALAQVFYSTMNLFFKLLNSQETHVHVPALEVIFIRMAVTWVGCVLWMSLSGTPYPLWGPPEVRTLLALRGFVGFFGLFGLYYSLQYLSLADATVITFLGPLCTGFLGYLTLGETFTRREALAGVASLVGVILIARPKFLFGQAADADLDMPVGEESLRWPSQAAQLALSSAGYLLSPGSDGLSAWNVTNPQPHDGGIEPDGVTEAERLAAVGVALVGVCGGAGAYISIRAIGRRATATHSIAYFALYSCLVSLFLMWVRGEPFVVPRGALWVSLLALVGIFGFIAQVLMTLGLQREKAGRAATAVYLQIIFATLWQFLFLDASISTLSAAGSLVILAAGAWVAAAK